MVEAAVEAVEEEEARQQEGQPRGEEEMRNSSERSHPPSMEIAKTSTDFSRIFKDICL